MIPRLASDRCSMASAQRKLLRSAGALPLKVQSKSWFIVSVHSESRFIFSVHSESRFIFSVHSESRFILPVHCVSRFILSVHSESRFILPVHSESCSRQLNFYVSTPQQYSFVSPLANSIFTYVLDNDIPSYRSHIKFYVYTRQ